MVLIMVTKDVHLLKKMFVKRIVDYIAKYYVEMGGCDGIVFTAGIGENSVSTRREVLDSLKILGIEIDEEKNKVRGETVCITTPNSSIPCYVIPTDEELMISRDTYNIIER